MSKDKSQSSNPGAPVKKKRRTERNKFNRNVLITILIIVFIAFIILVRRFLIPVVLAATFATLFYSFYKRLYKLFRFRKNLSSIVCCVLLLLCLFIPTFIIVNLVARQTIDLYNTTEDRVKEIIEKGDEGIWGDIKSSKLGQRAGFDTMDWQSVLQKAITTSYTVITAVVNKTWRGVFDLFTTLFIVFFTMFYFFRDGDRLIKRIEYLSPLRSEYEEKIFERFKQMCRATVKGTVLIGIIQGSLGSITLLVFGIHSWILWGFVMVILSIIPLVGAWLVLVPAAIVQIILGNTLQGMGILVCTLIISTLDNFLRPRLVGKDANMPDLLIFFSTLGGISVFGVMGFIVGPVIAALFLSILEIYGSEFKEELISNDN